MKYVNVITGVEVDLDYVPAGEAWQRPARRVVDKRAQNTLARRLLKEEGAPRRPRKKTQKEIANA
jgi:hypothetical protein